MEVRITDALTGGEKGSKPERYDLIPPSAMDEVARVFGYGVTKYADRNWERGYDWGLSIAALHRHIKGFERGESFDRESGLHHLAHAVFHCLALMTYEANGLGTDTRTRLMRPVGKEPEPEIMISGENFNRLLYEDGARPSPPPSVTTKEEAEAQWVADHEFLDCPAAPLMETVP